MNRTFELQIEKMILDSDWGSLATMLLGFRDFHMILHALKESYATGYDDGSFDRVAQEMG